MGPPTPHTTPGCAGGSRDAPECRRSEGHGRAANPPTSPGPLQLTPILLVSLGGEQTPPGQQIKPLERGVKSSYPSLSSILPTEAASSLSQEKRWFPGDLAGGSAGRG